MNYVAFATSRKAIEKTQIENVLFSKSSTQKKYQTPHFSHVSLPRGEKKTMFSQPCGYGSRLDTVPIHGSSQSLVISLRGKKPVIQLFLGFSIGKCSPIERSKAFILLSSRSHHPMIILIIIITILIIIGITITISIIIILITILISILMS